MRRTGIRTPLLLLALGLLAPACTTSGGSPPGAEASGASSPSDGSSDGASEVAVADNDVSDASEPQSDVGTAADTATTPDTATLPDVEPVEHVTGRVDHPVEDISGRMVSLHDYRGEVLLIVNTASRCGFTPQYEGLQQLHEAYAAQGLRILGFPANDFAGQEPGSNEEIADFCSREFGVGFQMFAKVEVTGVKTHDLYRTLTEEGPEELRGPIAWNFTKFLVDTNGFIVGRFEPATEPGDPAVVAAIEAALAAR